MSGLDIFFFFFGYIWLDTCVVVVEYIEESQDDGEEKEERSYNIMEEGVVNMLAQSKQMSIDNTNMDTPVIMFPHAGWENNLFRWHRSIAQECCRIAVPSRDLSSLSLPPQLSKRCSNRGTDGEVHRHVYLHRIGHDRPKETPSIPRQRWNAPLFSWRCAKSDVGYPHHASSSSVCTWCLLDAPVVMRNR